MSAYASSNSTKGFSFKNCFRNAMLEKVNIKAPEPYKTGTTISGVVYKDGVVLGADTRATAAPLIVDGDCIKIHHLADNIYCCGAGTCADVEAIVRIMRANFELMRLDSERLPRVKCATRMMKQMLFRYGGNLCAALIIGGVDATGPHIACVHPGGSSAVLPFATMGSGAYAAMAVLETGFQENMKLADAKSLVKESILAGIHNDLGSGSFVHMYIIRKDRAVEFKFLPVENAKIKRNRFLPYTYEPGTTSILEETVEDLEPEETTEDLEPEDNQTSGEDSDEDKD